MLPYYLLSGGGKVPRAVYPTGEMVFITSKLSMSIPIPILEFLETGKDLLRSVNKVLSRFCYCCMFLVL